MYRDNKRQPFSTRSTAAEVTFAVDNTPQSEIRVAISLSNELLPPVPRWITPPGQTCFVTLPDLAASAGVQYAILWIRNDQPTFLLLRSRAISAYSGGQGNFTAGPNKFRVQAKLRTGRRNTAPQLQPGTDGISPSGPGSCCLALELAANAAMMRQ